MTNLVNGFIMIMLILMIIMAGKGRKKIWVAALIVEGQIDQNGRVVGLTLSKDTS